MRWGLSSVLLAAALVVSALAVVHSKHRSRALVHELREAQLAHDRLETEWAQLQLEESAWSVHGRVEQMARERMRMVEPETYAVVRVRR